MVVQVTTVHILRKTTFATVFGTTLWDKTVRRRFRIVGNQLRIYAGNRAIHAVKAFLHFVEMLIVVLTL